MVMYNLVRFTIDGVYFVCRAKDLWRKGKKTITKWYDKLSYEVEVVTSSKKKKILDDLCGNLNGNKPRILLEVLREDAGYVEAGSHIWCDLPILTNTDIYFLFEEYGDYEIKKTSFENVDVQFSVHPEEYNDENNKETPKCIECSCTFELNDHLCFSFGESEISDFESPTNDELCMQCGILCPNLEEHLLTVHSSTQIAGELDFESPNNDELCMQCGILCPNLEEHLTAHSTTEIAVDNSKPNSGKYHLCMYCGVLCPGLKEHLVTSHGADGLDSDGVEVQTKQNHQSYESKQHFCVYCQTLHFKLARHLESRHHHEKDVEEALKYMKGCKQRKQLFLEIQKKGDFLYYTEHKESTIHLRRRPDSLGLIPCPYCKGFYSKKYLRNHVRLHCIVKSHQKKLEFEKNGLSNLVSKSRSLVPVTLCNANDILKSRIFPTMTENENFKALLSDELGVEYGNYLTTKYSSSKHHDKMIKAKLRQLSRLFLEMKKFNSNIEKMSSIFDPENFNTFVEAIYSMAGLKDGKFETPSLGPSTVTLILDVGGVLETETIKNKNEKMERNCKRFCKLLKTKCNSLINRIAMENRTQQQRGKTVVLPKTEDIRNLVNSLEIEMKNCLNFMQKDFIYQKWITLNKVVLTKIMVYNRKRPGDVEKSRIIEYRNIEMLNEEQIQHLQGSDRDFGTKYGRYITRGKLDRPAAVLVSRNDMDAIDLILQYRRSAGVDDNNPYLFATPCGMAEQFFKVGKALKDYCVENNFSNKNLTATNMRKHLATVTCSFGKDEQMQVSDFMGHAFNIHQNIYRQRPASLDILGMSKLLNYASGVEEPGTSSNSQVNILSNIRLQPDYMNNPEPHRLETEHLPDKNFKFTSGESIRSVECVTPCQMYSSEEDEEDNNFVPDLSTVEENDNTSDEEYSCSHSYSRTRENSERLLPKSYRITRKKTWSTPERVTMRKIFRHYLNENIEDIPTLETCQNFTYQNPVLSSRSPAQMKAWIVQEKKRNKTGSKSGWTTPLRKKCRKKFENFYSSGKYPSSSELMDIIEESPDVSLTVSKLRSHLQHDFKYAKRQHQQGRRFF